MKDWNKLTIEESVHHLRKRYGVDSSGDAKCIFKLIEFYDEAVKNNVALADVVGQSEQLTCKCVGLAPIECNKINDKWICCKCNRPLAG